MRLRHAFRQISDAKARKRGIEHLRRGVESELTVNAYFQLAAGLLEFPGV
jgi:hypothetical protein